METVSLQMIFEGYHENLMTMILYNDAKLNGQDVKGTKEDVNQGSAINRVSKHLMLNNGKILLFR